MSKILPNIVGLDIGARRIGVAVFENERLTFYIIKTIEKSSQTDTINKLRRVLETLKTNYEIQLITLEQLVYLQQQRSFVKTVYEETKKFARKRKIKVIEFNPVQIRQIICQSNLGNKQTTLEVITKMYPQLRKFISTKNDWRKAYYAYLFNAIAVGLVCLKEIKSKSKYPKNE